MSLQVWLPLTGSLENKGLLALTSPNNVGAVINSNGKIGSCYSFNGSNQRIEFNHDKTIWNNKEISICMWYKYAEGNTSCTIVDIAADLCLSYTYSSSNVRFNYWRAYSANGTRTGDSGSSNYYDATKWHHVVLTCNHNINKIYVDGILDATFDRSTKYTTNWSPLLDAGYNKIMLAKSAGANPYGSGYLNDVRIYDHCLSAVEVKEISQGLVLHYQFDDTYAEITTNLYSGTFSNTCYNGATNKYSYGTTTDIYKTTGNFQGKESVKVYMGTAGLSAYPYIYFDAFNTVGTAVHTLSFDYYPTSQTSIIPYSYGGSYNISYITSNGAHDSKTNVSSIVIPVITNQWNHIAITMQKYDTTDTSRGNGYIRIGSASHTSTTSDYWLFANIQVEAKNHETGYTAPGTTRSNVQIYDSSGYAHNGTIINNPILDAPSPRYCICMHFNATNQKVRCGILNTTAFGNSYSFAWWAKMASNGPMHWGFSDGNRLNGLYQGNTWNTGDGNSNPLYNPGTTTQVTTPTAGVWHHFVMTGDGTTCKVYQDGVLWATAKTYKPINGTQIFINGWADATSYSSDNYSISDFRIYATALSADDVKKLYETSMSIDSAGNISARLLN